MRIMENDCARLTERNGPFFKMEKRTRGLFNEMRAVAEETKGIDEVPQLVNVLRLNMSWWARPHPMTIMRVTRSSTSTDWIVKPAITRACADRGAARSLVFFSKRDEADWTTLKTGACGMMTSKDSVEDIPAFCGRKGNRVVVEGMRTPW